MAPILVTGAAGFIGFHVCQELLRRGETVIGLDNLNAYYEVSLKEARLAQLQAHPQAAGQFQFQPLDLADRSGMAALFEQCGCDRVIHLAAQAGVRYSIDHPLAYADSNLLGFLNVLEGCRRQGVKHLVFASSSSVYGGNTKIPFAVSDPVDRPVSLYAATKRANELMAYTYSHLYGIPATGLRFFTVYGPWGRPDMAYFSFTRAIVAGEPIKVFNQGKMQRDFTYIDDIVEGVLRVLDQPPQGFEAAPESLTPAQADPQVPLRLYNIGNHQPVTLMHFIEVLERCLGKTATKEFLPMQPGDVVATYADVAALMVDVGFQPNTTIEVGLERFVQWYRQYYAA
ncbi:MAG: NAD-dependent epimerase [Prochlorothrix sp.]